MTGFAGSLCKAILEGGMSNWYAETIKRTEETMLFDITHYEEAITAAENSDYEAAFQSCIQTLEPKDAETQYNWGTFYYNGNGVKQDYEKAFKWFKLAADQNYERGIAALGSMYLTGTYVERNVIKAEEYLDIAASRGDEQSAYLLGLVYYQGYEGEISPDYEKAWKYLYRFDREAEEYDSNQFYDANCIYGMMCLLGQGVDRHYPTAARCLKRAADHNDEQAQYWLGVMYLSGLGVERDDGIGLEWLTKSAKNGFEDAKKLLDLKEKRDELLSAILQSHNQEEKSSTNTREGHHFFSETPYFGKAVLSFDFELDDEREFPTGNKDWARTLFIKCFSSAYKQIQANEIVSLKSEVSDYILKTDPIKVKENKFLIGLKDYLNDSIDSFRKRFDSVINKYTDIQNNLENLYYENASFFSDKWSVSEFVHQIFDDYIFLIEFLYDIEFLYTDEVISDIKQCLVARLKNLIKVWKSSVGNPIVNSGISDNPPNSLGVEFSATVVEAISAFSDLKKQLEVVKYNSTIRQVPCSLIENPEYVVFVEKQEEEYNIPTLQLFKPDKVLQHISTIINVKTTIAINLNYLETISDDYLAMYEYIAELCENSKGIIYISNFLLPGRLASLLFNPRSSLIGERKRFQRGNEIIPLLTIELDYMNHKRSRFEKRPINEVDRLVITNANISYMIPVITEAVKTLISNAGCYEKNGLKDSMDLYEKIHYNHSDKRIAELYE